MKQQLIADVLQGMLNVLDNAQLKQLESTLHRVIEDYEVQAGQQRQDNDDGLLATFIAAKRLEGCSEKTLTYYERTITAMLNGTSISATRIRTEDLRTYLTTYQQERGSSQITIDNIRRILSSFFAWLEDEDHIVKSPVRRIHKVKAAIRIKETYTDEELETMRDRCPTSRDLAMIDMLASTGMRVGELVKLNRADIDFGERECVVQGKGNKERVAYFDARTKIHLRDYLDRRDDDDPALFVGLYAPHRRLSIGAIEARLRQLGTALNIEKVHPHKFRRTLATKAIDKGMPVEQLQHLLGHQRIDTTLQYAMVRQTNVKNAHRRYIGQSGRSAVETKTLAEIGTVVTGKTPSTSRRDYYGGCIPFITPNELHEGRLAGKSAKTLSEAGLQSIRGSIIEGTSVLVGCIGWDMGNVAMTSDRCASNQQINAVTKIDSDVNPAYLYYWLSTKKDYLFSIASVTRTPILSKSTFEQVKVPLPSREVQDGITRILTSIDDQIAANVQVNDNLQAMLQTLYGYWFLQFDFPDENGRPYRSSGGRMIWNDQLKREIPADWRAVKLREILKKNRQKFGNGTVEPTIDLSVMPSGSIALNSLSRSDAFSSNLYRMSEGDILFGSIRPYLKKAGVAPCNGAAAGTVHSFSPIRARDYNFGLATMTSEQMFSHAIRSSTGTRMPTIKADELLDVTVAYSEPVAKSFNQIQIAQTIINRVQENLVLGDLRDWLLPMLMNGQATVASSDKLSFT